MKFTKEYQPQKKWTEEKALKIGNDLIDWLKEDEANIFFEEFLFIKNDYYKDLIRYLSRKYNSFFDLLGKAKKIQEIKLVKYGVADRLNATMTKFVLTIHHGYQERQELEVKQTNIVDLSKFSQEDLKKAIEGYDPTDTSNYLQE